jgi:queuine/archaeosine tRNA-ribosyltransferase
MGAIDVHEFMSLEGVIDTPDGGFRVSPRMSEIIGAISENGNGSSS